MLNYRQFEAGPDPFGRKFQVYFKWLQTAISLRHADTVDVKFLLEDDTGVQAGKTIALPHAELLAVSREMNRGMDDPWCARIAACHLQHLVATGEDMEKDLVTVTPADLRLCAREAGRTEQPATASR